MESDLGLLDAARRMDQDALVRIFDLYAGPIYSYALRLCSDPLQADNVVGDVFSKLLEKLSKGHGPNSNLRSYLYEMTYHLIVDDARCAQREVSLELVDSYRVENFSATAGLENRLLFEKVMTVMRRDLTDDQRHVVILRFIEGFSLRETAAIIGKQVSNVKVIQNRAVACLRRALEYTVS